MIPLALAVDAEVEMGVGGSDAEDIRVDVLVVVCGEVLSTR